MAKYGMPYKGSKNAIADWIIDILPSADILIDAFGGGGAITHCAVLSHKWNKVIYNELEPVIAKGFKMAINGEFKEERRWISREDFFRLKDTDPYVAMCFSFGNDLKTYCYAKDIEEYKKMLHYVVMGQTTKERRIAWKRLLERLQNLESVSRLERLQNLERLQRLDKIQNIQNLERLQVFNVSYECLEIPKNCVVYCDIPYKDTNSYKSDFDYDKFYKWALEQDCYVFISEYEMPNEFYLVAEKQKNSSLGSNNNTKTIERLYCNKPYEVFV